MTSVVNPISSPVFRAHLDRNFGLIFSGPVLTLEEIRGGFIEMTGLSQAGAYQASNRVIESIRTRLPMIDPEQPFAI